MNDSHWNGLVADGVQDIPVRGSISDTDYPRRLGFQRGTLEARYLEPGDVILRRAEGATERTPHTVTAVTPHPTSSDRRIEYGNGEYSWVSRDMPVRIVTLAPEPDTYTVRIGEYAEATVHCVGRSYDDRPAYIATIHGGLGTAHPWEYTDNTLRGGVSFPEDAREGMDALLSFLSAALESHPDGENAGLFPTHVREALDGDMLAAAMLEMDERNGL